MGYGRYRLLNVWTNAKTRKGDGEHTGFLTGILYLAPADLSGSYNVCQFATAGCKASCLNTAGRGGTNSVQLARLRKTVRLFTQPQAFYGDLLEDIAHLERVAAAHGLRPVVRLNGTSDLPWHKMRVGASGLTVLEMFPDVQFYDYTKDFGRMVEFISGGMPRNYDLTFSRSERNSTECETVLKHGGRVAVVFQNYTRMHYCLESWNPKAQSWALYDGDGNDLRFLDPKGTIIALKAKGRAKKDTTGFVVREVVRNANA